MDKKLKVVWLCHLTNLELNKKYKKEVDMCAFWMTQFIDLMLNTGIELHVVCPNYYTNTNDSFVLKGVHYHMYKFYSGFGNIKTAYVECSIFSNLLKKRVAKIIEYINPDLIHLFGAENITYSQAILPLMDKFPTILSLQGYIQNAEVKGNFLRRYVIKKRTKNEDSILKRMRHISFEELGNESKEFYLQNYGKGDTHVINFPVKRPEIDASTMDKTYDVVFWGRVIVDKGVEDLIDSISILKHYKTNIKCLILGGGSQPYLSHLLTIVKRLGLDDNIELGGFQKTNEELFRNAAKARVYVLPTHYDALPGSIRESMLMKLPVVSYPVGDIPLLNKNRESILLAKYRDIDDLALCIKKLLTDKDLYEQFTINGYRTACDSCDEQNIRAQILNVYDKVLRK